MGYSRYHKGQRQRKFKSDDDLLRWLLKREYKTNHGMPKEIKPLTEQERFAYNEDCDELIEYGFIQGAEGATDEEIQKCCDGERIRINSPYDCTGKWFTWSITWHRNPSGLVSYIHRKGLDV